MKDLLALREQLRKERQAVEADKKAIESVSSSVESLAHRVVCESWRDRQQWRNIDMLMKTRITAVQCAKRIQLIDKVAFQKYPLSRSPKNGKGNIDAGHSPSVGIRSGSGGGSSRTTHVTVDHPTGELSEFFTLLHQNPEILARVLIYADSCKLDSGPLVEIALSSVYGNFVIPQDAACILQLLDRLLSTQLPACRQPKLFFRGVACAFTRMLSLFCEGLFAAKTYLAEALHDCVKQILVDDSRLFEFEPAKLWTRMSEEDRVELFDENMLPLPHSESVLQDLELASAKVSSYCMLIVSRLAEYLPHMPMGLRWLVARLKMHLLQLKVVKSNDEIAPLLSDLMFGCFISPALAMPEAAIVPVDTTVSENARYNLTQVARILQGAASAALALKGDHDMPPHLRNVYNKVDLSLFRNFLDKITESVDVESPPPVTSVPGLHRDSIFITRLELSAVLTYFEKARLPLTSRGLPARLIPLLDSLMEHPYCNPDVGSARSSLPASTLSVHPEERRGRSLSTANIRTTVRDPPDAASKNRRQSQYKAPGVTSSPPSPQSRRLRRLRSEHFRPPSEVQVVPLQATMPCGHVDLLPIEEVLQQAASAGKIISPVSTETTRSVGESTAAQLTDEGHSSQPRGSFTDGNGKLSTQEPLSSADVASHSTQPSASATSSVAATHVPGKRPPPPSPLAQGSGVFSVPSGNADTDDHPDGEHPSAGEPSLTAAPQHTSELGNVLDEKSKTASVSLPNLRSAGESSPPTKREAEATGKLERSGSLSTYPAAVSSQGNPVPKEGLLPPPIAPEAVSTSSDLGLDLTSVKMAHHRSKSSSETSIANSDIAPEESSTPPKGRSEVAQSSDDPFGAPPTEPRVNQVNTLPLSPTRLGKKQPKIVASSAQAMGGQPERTGQKLTVSDSFRDYCVISSPEEVAKHLTQSVEESGTQSVWQRMAASRWSVGSLMRHGSSSMENGVGKLAMRTWESISKSAAVTGNLLRRMSVTASSEMLEARQRQDRDDLEAWLKATETSRFADIQSDDAWENIPLFNLLRWRIRRLLSEPSESGLAESSPSLHSNIRNLTLLPSQGVAGAKSLPFAGRTYTLFDSTPESTDPQVSLLFRCLTQHLNTSRYMHNQEACTVVHDTINLLKQMPEHGIRYLLEVLERDYYHRSHYHVYLYNVKQQLLQMENYLLSTLQHIDRHQHCSLQFFMANCVRLFLERLTDSLEQFVAKFEQAPKPTEKAQAMEAFLSDIYARMDEDPMWSASQEHLYTAAQLALERVCFTRVYDDAFRPNGDKDREDDQELSDRIECLARIITVRHRALQIPEKYCRQAPWPAAVEVLSHISLYKTPFDKLNVIHACCQSIMRSLSVPCLPNGASPSSFAFLGETGGLDADPPGADDFFPVLVYVILSTNPPALVSTVNFVNTFQGNRLFGEVSYCWTQFCTALEFIKMIEL